MRYVREEKEPFELDTSILEPHKKPYYLFDLETLLVPHHAVSQRNAHIFFFCSAIPLCKTYTANAKNVICAVQKKRKRWK